MRRRVVGSISAPTRRPIAGEEQRENEPFQFFGFVAASELIVARVMDDRDVIGDANVDQLFARQPSAVLAKLKSLRTSEESISIAAASFRLKTATPLRICASISSQLLATRI